MKKKHYLLLLLVLLTALGGVAQQYRLNRQKLCLEGGSFARKAPISNENYMYIPNFRLARGETKVSIPFSTYQYQALRHRLG